MNILHISAQSTHLQSSISTIPGDKSISHRSVIFGSLADGISTFENVLFSEDCVNTIRIFQALGVTIQTSPGEHKMTITGVGLHGLKSPTETLDVGNSGTGIRLISGVLAGQSFPTEITGDASIQKRPMKRIVDPLSQMGATLTGNGTTDIYPPLKIQGKTPLNAIHYHSPVASAQVKSAVLLAGLYADGPVTVTEPSQSRDHTERMMKAYGVSIDGTTMQPPQKLTPPSTEPLWIPSDFSSAAFFIVLALLVPNTDLTLTGIGLNPTRATLIDILKEMGGDITVTPTEKNTLEPYGNIRIKTSRLHNITVPENVIPFIIDEIPILAVAGLFASGTLVVRGAKELRIKESDRIHGIIDLAMSIGGNIVELEDGFDLTGVRRPLDFSLHSKGDHRLAMSGIIAALAGKVDATILDCECINTSFPNFLEILGEQGVGVGVDETR